jgi:hypothetical protein
MEHRCTPTRFRGAVGPGRHPGPSSVPGLLTGSPAPRPDPRHTYADRPFNARQEHRHPHRPGPQRNLGKMLQQAVVTAKLLFDADAAGVMLGDAVGPWGPQQAARMALKEDVHSPPFADTEEGRRFKPSRAHRIDSDQHFYRSGRPHSPPLPDRRDEWSVRR